MKFLDSNINVERIGPAFEACVRRVQSNFFFGWLYSKQESIKLARRTNI